MALTTAHLRRTLTPGTKLRVVNHWRLAASRETSVHARTNTRALATWATDRDGEDVASFLDWPKTRDLRPTADPNTFDVYQPYDKERSRPDMLFLTVTIVPDDHPDAADWPTTSRPITTPED